MHLVKRSLKSRGFLIQFFEVMQEFGAEIPWLAPLKNLGFSTNSVYFRDQLLQKLNCHEEAVIPYQLTTADRSKEFVGGYIHFPKSPEVFRDPANKKRAGSLTEKGVSYVTCLQIRQPYRREGIGSTMVSRMVKRILANHDSFWGVVSSIELVSWYQQFGARLESTADNDDGLWIISWCRDE